jgi:hypothetical protein
VGFRGCTNGELQGNKVAKPAAKDWDKRELELEEFRASGGDRSSFLGSPRGLESCFRTDGSACLIEYQVRCKSAGWRAVKGGRPGNLRTPD